MKAEISGKDLRGSIRVPGSKSFSQRYILMSALSGNTVRIDGISYSEDEQACISIAAATGAHVEYKGHTITVRPDFRCPPELYVGESATAYRMAVGMMAARCCRTRFTGNSGLGRRPMESLVDAYSSLGATFTRNEDGFMEMDASRITPGDVTVDQTASSQYVSSLLMFMAFSEKRGTIRIQGKRSSMAYIGITASCLGDFGFTVSGDESGYSVSGEGRTGMLSLHVERDYSSAAFFMVLGALSSRGGITMLDMPEKSLQGDSSIMEILGGMGSVPASSGLEGCVDITSQMMDLKHIEVDAALTPDLAPPLSVIGIFSREGVTIRNAERLSIKESDRYHEIIRLAGAFGADVAEGHGDLVIKRGEAIMNPGELEFTDHRMVMSAIIAGLASGYRIRHGGLECINKSYPSFLQDIGKLGAEVHLEPVL